MLQVIYCYLLAILGIVNSRQIEEPVLSAVNVVVAVFFLVVGSIAGWQFARRD